jgi:hypothetical protein
MLQSSSSWSFLNHSQSASLYDVPSCETRTATRLSCQAGPQCRCDRTSVRTRRVSSATLNKANTQYGAWSPYFDHVRSQPLKHAAIEMKRRICWLSRRNGDGEATKAPNAPEEMRASPQHPAAPRLERPKPRAFIDSLSSTSSIPHLSAANSRSPPSLTMHTNHLTNASTENVQHSTSQDGIMTSANSSKQNYWQLAVDQLKEEDSLIAGQIAGVQRAAAAVGNTDFAAQLLHTTEARSTRTGIQEMEDQHSLATQSAPRSIRPADEGSDIVQKC